MTATREQVRRAVLEVVQQNRRGRILKTESLTASLGNLIGFGGDHDGFIRTAPFGFIAKPTPDVFAYYNNLNGDPLAPIILGYQHQNRPDATGVGGSLLYSTTDTGKIVKSFIELFNDGQIDFQSIDGSLIRMLPDGRILLGSGASGEPLILGNAFATIYNSHTHIGNLGAPTGPPLVPISAAHLSSKSFTEL